MDVLNKIVTFKDKPSAWWLVTGETDKCYKVLRYSKSGNCINICSEKLFWKTDLDGIDEKLTAKWLKVSRG